MKLVIDNLGKTIIAIVVVILCVVLVSTVFVPGVRDLVNTIFPGETNYLDKSGENSALTLSSAATFVNVNVGEDVDLFSSITAKSRENEDLVAQLTDDYSKPVSERSHVFIYKMKEDGSPEALKGSINTDEPGKWTVVYLINDDVESVSTKVLYVVK